MKSRNERPGPMGHINFKKRNNKRRRIIVNVIFISIGFLFFFLWLFWRYRIHFRVSNWGKYYWQKIPWKEIWADPKSHVEPIISFFTIGIIVILTFIVSEKMKNKKKLKKQKKVEER
jgi:hypothetical protein